MQVSLVGAGPGDAGLITVAGLDRLRRADVVVYDALANPALLDEAPADALRIDAGKRARQHKLTQDAIHELLREHAAAGRYVVRLKGGDPYLFGRGAEELAYLAGHGIVCEVIPGITAGIAAPMAAGIPVTHRGHASSVTFVTGHEDPTKPDTALDYAALARLIAVGGTVCFYMGLGRLPMIAHALVDAGLDAAAPAAAVQWGTTPRQRSVRAPLHALATAIEREGIGAPAIIVVGAVAGLDEPGLDYFTARPLFGKTVLVTRTRQQASKLREQLATLGADVIEAPTIDVTFLPTAGEATADLDAELVLGDYHWLILTSANAVTWLARWLDSQGQDARTLAGPGIAVVGEATAEALRQQLGVRADFIPHTATGEALANEMIERWGMLNLRCLLVRGDLASPKLPALLRAAGAEVVDCTVYHTTRTPALPDTALSALRERRVDWITFTSASTARNLVQLLGDERDLLRHARLASIGPITSDALRELDLPVTVEAAHANIPGLVDAIVSASSVPGGSAT